MRRLQHREEIQQRINTAHRRTISHANATRLQKSSFFGKPCRLNGFIRRSNRKHSHTTCTANLFAGIFGQVIKNRTCQARIHLRIQIPFLHADNAIFQSLERSKNIFDIHAQGRNATTTSNNNATGHAKPPFTEITWRVM